MKLNEFGALTPDSEPRIVVYEVRPVGFNGCCFETREEAEREAAELRREGDKVRVRCCAMSREAWKRAREFEGY